MFDKTTANITNLPGQRLYKEDTYLTPFKLSDVRALYNISQTADDRQLAGIIGKHINHDVHELTLHDFTYCMYWQRINSYPSSPMKITWTCPHCNKVNNSHLENKSLVINMLDNDYEHGMQVPLPSLEKAPKMRLQLVGDEEKARKFLREKRKINTPDVGQLREAIVACLLSPEWPDMNVAYTAVIGRLTPDDIFTIQCFEELFAYGVEDYGQFVCEGKESCGREARVNFRFDLTQFFPQDTDRNDLRSKILSLRSSKSADEPTGGERVGGMRMDGEEESKEIDGDKRGPTKSRTRGSIPGPISGDPMTNGHDEHQNHQQLHVSDDDQERIVKVPLQEFLSDVKQKSKSQ